MVNRTIRNAISTSAASIPVFPVPITNSGRAPGIYDTGYAIGQVWINGQNVYVYTGTILVAGSLQGQWLTGGNDLATTTNPGIVYLSTLAQLEAGTAPAGDYVPLANDVYTFVSATAIAGGVPATTITQGLSLSSYQCSGRSWLLTTNYAINPASLAAVFGTPFALGSTTPAAGTFTALTAVGIVSLNASGTAATTIGGSSGALTLTVGAGNMTLVGGGNTIGLGK